MQGQGLNPRDLITTARELITTTDGKPRQSNLSRAISTAYYALFHTLARCCADMMIGGTAAVRSGGAWRQVYRALDHGSAKNACQNNDISKFPKEIQDFANTFVTMQAKRHAADYDPKAKAFKSAVAIDIDTVESVISGFNKSAVKDRRAFAAWVLFKLR
jgi:hypothetical protein